MKKARFLLLFVFMCMLSACSSGPSVEVTPTPEPTPLEIVVPEYSLINQDKYTQYGLSGIGYRVEVDRNVSEEDMRAIFADLCSGDTYDLHTVWFYEFASDIEDVGSFTVGMLEEESKGDNPAFSPCSYDEELISSMREKAAEEASLAALNRSIPSDAWDWKCDALVKENSFSPVDEIIFSTFGSENGLADSRFFVDGSIEDVIEADEYDLLQVSTEYGRLYVGEVPFWPDFRDYSIGDSVSVFFVYGGWSDGLNGPVGTYVYHE